ncbi:unnamed protein product [Rotaria magnacalcarata]|uniref:Uncharacterized protein n=2 Tax=Rotaria magnacalcarata TaxID=392030 RepID=A0A814JPG6_9BILA|nr:unnamed protein product [Rotaria magnacalcarata]CAF1617455.1 unnamed protein product [Rotaria magnacalcarata]CAF2115688.1 unnamed protein product [Rotaria magnacalcarata]CAF4564998.1 unnamed protein product [Rotaria magnacalcarata]CAF4893618.1 unnamed protein product [Rotaria magnacalcarata]
MDNNELFIVNNIDDFRHSTETESVADCSSNYAQYRTKQVSTLSKEVITKSTTTTPETSSEALRTCRRRITQNFLLVWLDININKSNDDFQHSFTQLRTIVNTLEYFSDADKCVEYLRSLENEKAFIIICGAFTENIVSLVHDLPQVDTIFGLYSNNEQQQEWSKEWPKVEGVHDSLQSVCKSLKNVALKSDHNAIPMSFVPEQIIAATTSGEQNLDRLDPSYMHSMLFKDILFEIEEDETKAMNDLVTYYHNQDVSEVTLEKFQREYLQNSPVWCYTRATFLFGTLNKALRLLDKETMIKMGFFIRNLHRQLQRLHKEQSRTLAENFSVYIR